MATNFVRALRSELQREAYDCLHCHHDLVSSIYLLAAAGTKISRRIVHVHNADEAVLTANRLKQFLYRGAMRRICLAMADKIVGNSQHTLDTFLNKRSRRFGRDTVHYYGVDGAPFRNAAADRLGFRRQIGLASDALILLFAGRVVPEKNPVFAVDVLAELKRIEPSAVAIFAGAGSQMEAVRTRARELSVEDSTHLIGWRTDLPEIMSSSDWFILPHPEVPMEGFGLAVLEAQLAGLPLLLSRGIPDDPLLPNADYRRLALAAGAMEWARAAIELHRISRPSRMRVMAAFKQSPMEMDRALQELMALHA
jgi:glycosyltransferase involved in cell wall biosynthesis